VVLVTDGVLDSGRPRLDHDGLTDVLGSCRRLPPAQIAARIHHTVATAQSDDIAILVVTARD